MTPSNLPEGVGYAVTQSGKIIAIGRIAQANGQMAVARNTGYVVAAGHALAKDEGRHVLIHLSETAKAVLDPALYQAGVYIAIADQQSLALEALVQRLISERRELMQQLNQMGSGP